MALLESFSIVQSCSRWAGSPAFRWNKEFGWLGKIIGQESARASPWEHGDEHRVHPNDPGTLRSERRSVFSVFAQKDFGRFASIAKLPRKCRQCFLLHRRIYRPATVHAGGRAVSGAQAGATAVRNLDVGQRHPGQHGHLEHRIRGRHRQVCLHVSRPERFCWGRAYHSRHPYHQYTLGQPIRVAGLDWRTLRCRPPLQDRGHSPLSEPPGHPDQRHHPRRSFHRKRLREHTASLRVLRTAGKTQCISADHCRRLRGCPGRHGAWSARDHAGYLVLVYFDRRSPGNGGPKGGWPHQPVADAGTESPRGSLQLWLLQLAAGAGCGRVYLCGPIPGGGGTRYSASRDLLALRPGLAAHSRTRRRRF